MYDIGNTLRESGAQGYHEHKADSARVCPTDLRASTMSFTTAPMAVFICAANHSGSTLLDLLIGSHPDAMSLGEITQLPKNLALNTRCSCGAPIRECPLWATVVDDLAALPKFSRIHADPYVLDLGFFEASTVIDARRQTALRGLKRRALYAAAYAHWVWRVPFLALLTRPLVRRARNKLLLFDVVAQLEKRPLLVDSSKHYLEAAALYLTAPARTKIVFLVRDGRAVFYSGLKRGRARRAALDTWRNTYARAEPLFRRIASSGALLRVRYEDLAADPARELQRICRFIDLRFDDRMLDFRSRPHHVANGNDMRLKDGAAIRIDEAWKQALSLKDLAYFEKHAGVLNRRLGYDTTE
jgi:hypothetical protein